MAVEIRNETSSALAAYSDVSVAFDVASVFDIGEAAGRYTLAERRLHGSFRKDYDAIDGNSPLTWPERFRIDEWGFFSARSDGRWVGASAVAPGGSLLPSADDSSTGSVLWDLRVAPANRRTGIAHALLASAEQWARDRNCNDLFAETQNINVAACRFYGRHGFVLDRVDRTAYPAYPDEVQLIWRKHLAA